MTTWILIVYFSSSYRTDQAVDLGNYKTKAACEAAGKMVSDKAKNTADWYVCVSD